MKEQILKLRAKGYSYRQIQSKLGCSKGTIAYHLGEGQKEKANQRRVKHISAIRKYIQEFKQQRVCADCKENYPYYMMDFDHLGDKKFSISGFRTHTTNLDKIKEEIEKCEVVCANCHRIRTYQRSSSSRVSVLDIEEFYQ